MGKTDKIEAFIVQLLKNETDEWLEIGRNELASIFGCVPSQINYVISTRFSPRQGYIVESRRGGGGYLRIKRIEYADGAAAQMLRSVGESLSESEARTYVSELLRRGAVNENTAAVMLAAVSDTALAAADKDERDKIRASVFKSMLAVVGG